MNPFALDVEGQFECVQGGLGKKRKLNTRLKDTRSGLYRPCSSQSAAL